MAYSKDLRMKVVEAYEEGEGTSAELAERFKLNQKTVLDWLRRFRETGDVQPSPHGGGAQLKLTEEVLAIIKELLQQQNDLTSKEIQHSLEQQNTQISATSVDRAILELGWSRKKKRFMTPKRTRTPSKTK